MQIFVSSLWTPILTYGLFILSRSFSPILSASYKKLSLKEKYNWDSRYGSHIYAIFVLSCLEISPYEKHTDIFFEKNDTSRWLAEVTIMYFLTDALICIFFKIAGYEIILHHVFVILGMLSTLTTGYGQLTSQYMLIAEGTTFFCESPLVALQNEYARKHFL